MVEPLKLLEDRLYSVLDLAEDGSRSFCCSKLIRYVTILSEFKQGVSKVSVYALQALKVWLSLPLCRQKQSRGGSDCLILL